MSVSRQSDHKMKKWKRWSHRRKTVSQIIYIYISVRVCTCVRVCVSICVHVYTRVCFWFPLHDCTLIHRYKRFPIEYMYIYWCFIFIFVQMYRRFLLSPPHENSFFYVFLYIFVYILIWICTKCLHVFFHKNEISWDIFTSGSQTYM